MKEEEWQYGKKTEPSLFNSEGKLLKTHSYFHKFSADTKTCNMLEALPSEVQSCNVFLYEIDNDFINRLTEQISPLEKEKAQLMGAASKEIIDVTKDVLGFSPTLENVFRMLFAHIDAFMTSFYNLLSIIDSKRDTTRKLRLLPSLKLANTDIDSKDTEDCSFLLFREYMKMIRSPIRGFKSIRERLRGLKIWRKSTILRVL